MISMTSTFAPGWKHYASVLYGTLLLILPAYASGQSLEFEPNLSTYAITEGGTVRLQCVLVGTHVVRSPQSFTWTGPGLNNGHATVQHSNTVSTLTINSVRDEDKGQYSCSYPGLPTVSITVEVIVTPGFLNVPERQVFAEGTDAVVECPAFFGVDTSARMLWFHNLVTIRSGRCFSPENGRLTIHNIRMKDSDGNYQCSIFHNHGIVATKTIQIEVLPQSKFAPKIDDTNRRIEVAYGQPLNLPCRLKQQGESVTYSWTIDTEFEHDVLVNTTADLHIEAHKFVGGIYTCKAENEFGYDIADFSVKIIAAPLPSTCSTLTRITDVGATQTAVLKYCDLTTPIESSELTFHWKRKGNNSEELFDVQTGQRFRVNHNGFLTIRNIQRPDLGVYQVNISNQIDFAIHTVQLEFVEETPSPTPMSQSQALVQPPDSHPRLDGVHINLKFYSLSRDLNCQNIEEEKQAQDFIKQHLFDEFGFDDVVFEGAIVKCPSHSKFGIFKASLRGRNADKVVSRLKQRGLSDLTLENGLILRLKICLNECSIPDPNTPNSMISGAIVAALFICVVVAGIILLMVILVRYRRRSSVKFSEEKQVLPLHLSGTVQPQPGHSTNQDQVSVSKKPVYGRSVSLTLPNTSY